MAVVDVDWLEDRELRLQAAGVAARALRDNPGSVVVTPDPLVRFDLDDLSAVGWLETDTPENVRFYSALGFEVTDETTVLSSPVWFMRRLPPGRHRPGSSGRGGT